ncbi:M2 family metallopeptidase [Undibacterium sp. Jales W-56]|uniref:M2 family metallopeptidase n=1 Tax=Undibacterium sp. Jales W-56 TaxID=2897325 RepID=UPI0021CFC115|nr:M2 family metallopeptidase [Undibacterium sp. Jales W-56]MCU6435602.1 M2 family metallopeptidase [Undibacterium sp. Jales W-56]
MRYFKQVAPAFMIMSLALAYPASGFAQTTTSAKKTATVPTVAEAEQFLRDAELRLQQLSVIAQRAAWVYETHITEDTEAMSAQASEQALTVGSEIAIQARRYNGLALSADSKRKLKLLQLNLSFKDAADREAYTRLGTSLAGEYGKAKYCKKPGDASTCLDLGQMEEIMAQSHDPAVLKDVWMGWHQQASKYKDSYVNYVAVSNKGAREMGFADTGALWRSQYDMSADAFEADTERLWQQVKPLYDALHLYVRLKLRQTYGPDVVPLTGPVPAHLFGNMWSQSWENLYPLVKPQGQASSLDVGAVLKQKNIDAKGMTQYAEGFYTSLGMEKLPPSFWQRSMLTKPRDREVVCHASAWDLDNLTDVRVKMCINQTTEDFITIHHELGHIYYDLAYRKQPHIFKAGANDGFHEAIGDTVALSVTPEYLKKIGLLSEVPDASQDIGVLLNRALEKVAFLPFGYLVDQWRWKVYSGKVAPADYDKVWWELREKYQGIKRPAPMEANGFDAGAKYHVPADTPYARYFIAHILQFQLHRGLCKEAGYVGPLNRCSIFEDKKAGAKYQAMLAMGASRPWNEALKAVSGEDKMDASAILDYFAPLKVWLDAQNKQLAQ